MCQIQQATTGRGETYTPRNLKVLFMKGFLRCCNTQLCILSIIGIISLTVTVGWPVEQLAVCKWQSPGSVEAANLSSREGMGTVFHTGFFGHEPFCGTDFHGKMIK